jgi:hypothetical protein
MPASTSPATIRVVDVRTCDRPYSIRFLTGLVMALAAGVCRAGPVPIITATTATEGMAPFTIHLHGLRSTLDAGHQLTARYEWSFGDAGSEGNELVGWNSAHTYDTPGDYIVRLRITDETGVRATESLRVHVHPAARTVIHVSPDGSDLNPGTMVAPIRTVARAQQLLGDNVAIRFRRGATYSVADTLVINSSNVLIGAYGPGELPVLRGQNGVTTAGIISVFGNAENVVIERIRFDTSLRPPTNANIRGIRPSGRNITIRRCDFGDVSYAINSEFAVHGLMVSDNSAGLLGAYFVWGVGSDHVYLRNHVRGSIQEHNIRLGGVNRALVAGNDLTNTIKTTIWAMLGQDVYIAGNTLRRGRMIIGPDYLSGAPSDRMRRCVAEGNLFLQEGVIVYAGAERIALRNNIIDFDGGEAFSVWGWHEPMQRAARDVSILHNTAVNRSWFNGAFLRLGADARRISAENNLYCAPHLNGTGAGTNVHSNDHNLQSHYFHGNLWAWPAQGDSCHLLSTGGVPNWRWDAFNQTDLEQYRAFADTDLDEWYQPQFPAIFTTHPPGVLADYFGRRRPPGGHLTVGAVEMR